MNGVNQSIGNVIFLLPTSIQGLQGPIASWLNTAGWAAAVQRLGGNAYIVTPGGLRTPEQLRSEAARQAADVPIGTGIRRWVPLPTKTLAKDVRDWGRARGFAQTVSSTNGLPLTAEFVWQRHELFHRAGLALSRNYGCPLVLYVAAPKLREAQRWGVRRPGWRTLLERIGERQVMVSADLVACVSDEVASMVQEMGVSQDRLVVTPSTVDAELFSLANTNGTARLRLGLGSETVIGWAGSFRSFHSLDVLIEAFECVVQQRPTTRLLLVGAGAERQAVQDDVEARGLASNVIFCGPVAQIELPEYIAAMDIAVVPAHTTEFHYSPLKLWEFLAMERAVVAPLTGMPMRMLQDGFDACLVPPGSPSRLAETLINLVDDDASRETIQLNARSTALRHSWDHQVERVRDSLARVHNS